MTTGEVAARFADVYGATVSKHTISRITDKMIGEMTDWCNRPLAPVNPVVFIDAIHVEIHDDQVANRPIYVAVGVTSPVNATSSCCRPATAVRARSSGSPC